MITFEIRFKRWRDRRAYKATVQLVYQSENVLRFVITAGKKEMKMEKWLFRKTNQWKVTGANFTLAIQLQETKETIEAMQRAIDNYLNSSQNGSQK